MARMFGTDGVRGIANEELTPLLAMQLGQAGPKFQFFPIYYIVTIIIFPSKKRPSNRSVS